ncbi:MAG TPA: hypothetical protein VF476_12005 [Chitinophagaceae bacterium]
MFNFFQRTPVYLKIYPNKIEIINLKTGESITRTALEKFSTERLVIADFNAAEKLAREIKKELGLPASLKVLAQQMKVYEETLSEAEKRMLRDIAEQMGAVSVFLVTNDIPVSNAEALEVLRQN